MLATSYHIVSTCRNVRPHLIWNGQMSTNLYQKAVETLFMDFAHCVYLWNVYLFIFRIHCLFMYVFLLFPEVQKLYVFWHCARLFVYVFLLFPEVQKCYVFRHCARLFVYLCIYFISRSPEMLCFQVLCTLQDRFISVVSFRNRHHTVLNKYTFLPLLLHVGLHQDIS